MLTICKVIPYENFILTYYYNGKLRSVGKIIYVSILKKHYYTMINSFFFLLVKLRVT